MQMRMCLWHLPVGQLQQQQLHLQLSSLLWPTCCNESDTLYGLGCSSTLHSLLLPLPTYPTAVHHSDPFRPPARFPPSSCIVIALATPSRHSTSYILYLLKLDTSVTNRMRPLKKVTAQANSRMTQLKIKRRIPKIKRNFEGVKHSIFHGQLIS